MHSRKVLFFSFCFVLFFFLFCIVFVFVFLVLFVCCFFLLCFLFFVVFVLFFFFVCLFFFCFFLFNGIIKDSFFELAHFYRSIYWPYFQKIYSLHWCIVWFPNIWQTLPVSEKDKINNNTIASKNEYNYLQNDYFLKKKEKNILLKNKNKNE